MATVIATRGPIAVLSRRRTRVVSATAGSSGGSVSAGGARLSRDGRYGRLSPRIRINSPSGGRTGGQAMKTLTATCAAGAAISRPTSVTAVSAKATPIHRASMGIRPRLAHTLCGVSVAICSATSLMAI